MGRSGFCSIAFYLTVAVVADTALACPIQCKCHDSTIYGYVTDCSRAGLPSIPDGIEQRTEYLDLSGNRIESVAHVQLRLLSLVRTIFLSENNIASIEDGSFRDMASLENLYLRINKLGRVSAATFTGLGKVGLIDLEGNSLTRLSAGTFTANTELTHVMLPRNSVDDLNYEAFRGLLKLRYINARQNRITTVSGSLLNGLPELRHLDVSSNPLHCDCNMRDFNVWLGVHGDGGSMPDHLCATPSNLAGRSLAEVDTGDLTCPPAGLSTGAAVGIAIGMFLLGGIVVAVLAFLYFRHRGIKYEADTMTLTESDSAEKARNADVENI